MTNLKTTLFLLTLALFCFIPSSQAQEKGSSKVYLQKQMRNLTFENRALNAGNFFDQQFTRMGLTSPAEMQWTKTIAGENGYEHLRYQQVYQSIPVFGTAYTIHQKNGVVTHASGYYLPLIDLVVRPQINAETALQIAMKEMGAKQYTFEKKQNSMGAFPEKRPIPDLVIIDRAFPNSSEQYALAYRITLASSEPLDKQEYFIDAHNGVALLNLPLHLHNAVPAQGVTKYYGTQAITVDSISPNEFLLRDPSRNGNATYDGNQEVWSNTSNVWDFTNKAQDEVAIDAHYCTQEFHDFMLEKLNWNGLDNAGLPMNIVVHAGNFVNAFWNGQYAAFGDGDCNRGPLTTLEVVGHEFMHGVTDHTSDLVYRSESGAINESMSDIFGKALEFYTTPDDFDWNLGSSFIETPYVESFRSFSDPNSRNHPKSYKGEFWQDGGGVHTNSSVGNHWFYQMVNGGSGVNEKGEPYDIEPLGMNKAIQIVFLTQKAYLTSTSTYNFYYENSLLAAEELYGENAPEIQSVKEAWKVVGLPYAPGSGEDLDLAISFPVTFTQSCLNNQFYNTEVTVTNIGGIPYTPNLEGSITVYGGVSGSFYEIFMEDSIASGASRVFPLEDLFFFETDGSKYISADLQIMDENSENNSASQFVNNSFYLDNDLEISNTSISESNCIDNLHEVSISVRNNACNIVPAGTSFTIEVTNPVTGYFWSTTRTLDSELFRYQRYEIMEILDLEPSEDYVAELIFSEDVNVENNFYSFPDNFAYPVIGIYDNPMDEEDSRLVKLGFFPSEFLEYNGTNVLALSSYSQEAGSLCLEAVDNLENSSFGRSGTYFFCADLTEMENPNLGFDLTQFRNPEAIAFSELEHNAVLFKASWQTETEEYSQMIVDQPEGILKHYDLPLPAQFKGKIKFDFFHNTGDLFSPDYLGYDVSLLDNLTLSQTLVNTNNIASLPLKIQPNPSAGLLIFTHPLPPKKLVLRNTQGQILRTLNPSHNLNQLDISDLPDSYYFLTISYGKLGQVTRGVVKMSE